MIIKIRQNILVVNKQYFPIKSNMLIAVPFFLCTTTALAYLRQGIIVIVMNCFRFTF